MIRRTVKVAVGIFVIVAACGLIIAMILSSGLADEWLRDVAIRQIDQRTGARAEMGALHLRLFPIRVEIDNLTVHGHETPAAPPLFHADRTDAMVRILSLFSRKFALERLVVEEPQVAIEIDRQGKNNLPTPRVRQTNRPWRDTLFNLRIADLELRNGTVQFADQKTPFDLDGSNLEFALHYQVEPSGQDLYFGNLQMKQVALTAKKWLPFRFNVSTSFVLQRDAFDIGDLALQLPRSQLNLSAQLPSFSRSDWSVKYRGRLALADLRAILRAPKTPDGLMDFSGDAHLTSGQWTGAGYYRATGIGMHYQWFHGSGMETAGNFQIANRRLTVPNLSVASFGGSLDGKLEMEFANLAFRTETHLHGDDLHAVLDALNNASFPVDALHWDAAMEVDSVNSWNANFKHFHTAGVTHWSPAGVAPGLIPITAQISYDYSADTQTAHISQGEITTPRMHLDFNGPISGNDSGLEVNFNAGNLLEWNDFINAIRGPDADRVRIAGTAAWRGRVLGPIAGPTFVGHVVATHSEYEQYAWDSLEGDEEYSPDRFRLTQATIQRGESAAMLDVSLDFDGDWGFLPSSPWNMDVRVRRGSIADLQYIMGTNFPASGILSGRLQGSGTRAMPALDANVVARDLQASSWHADRFSGQLHFSHDVAQLTNAELRQNGSSISGDVLYRPVEQEAEFNLAGSNLALDKFKALQTSSLPVGGELSFKVHGSGPLRSPTGDGSLTLTNLKLGTEVAGNFTGQVESDGRNAHLTLRSQLPRGQLMADLDMGLSGDEPISGRLVSQQVDLDPLIVASLHIGRPTGHSQVDGTFDVRGAVRRPDSIEVDADVTKLFVDYNSVQLTNDQDIRLTYRRNLVQVEQAHLHGTDTDFRISGSARFDQDRPLRLNLAGEINLALAKTIFSGLDAQGRADINVAIAGTMTKPNVTGEANVHDASAHYGDFPTGLTKANGTLRFNKSQLLFDNVTAEAGGGQLRLGGNMTYGEGPIRYEVRATTSTVRIRYPVGMSWLASGNLELSGDSNAAQISGRVEVQRLLLAQGTDVGSFLASASETAPGPPSTSLFLQNLSLDVEGVTTPGAQIVWTGAHVEVDGDVRLRGTFDRPILLGHVHLLSGEMPFRGNTYQLTRGDINFSDPFRLDPDLNIEAGTTINQYQVTIDFTGRASHLQMNYRSDPPLPDADIIALLALGSPGEESALRSGTSGNYGATALLSEAISSGIGSRIEHLFGISSFRVDPFAAETATESNATARITIRQQVSQDLAITYSTNATTNNQYQLIQVEYALKRNVSIVFLRDINGTYGCDVKFTKRIK